MRDIDVPKLKAIFFDMDNVLVFSERTHFIAWQQAMQQFDVAPEALDFHEMIGKIDTLEARSLIERFQLAISVEALCALKNQLFLRLMERGFECPAGRNQFLAKVSQHYITAVVSSSRVNVVNEVLASEKIRQYFDFVIGYEDCREHKPHPLPYLQALAQAKVSAEQALIIEDSPRGITAALRAEIPVLGIQKDQLPHELLAGVKYYQSYDEIQAEYFPNLA